MAVQSFQHLPNFDYHVIKCDSEGAVLFFPHPDPSKAHKYALYRQKPLATKSAQPLQVGNGDVMTAVFAFDFPPRDAPATSDVLRSAHKANAAVACYRDMPWHRMPSRREIEQKQAIASWREPQPDAEISKGVPCLPAATTVRMSTVKTDIEGLHSQDSAFRNVVKSFVTDIRDGWTSSLMKSVVLGAPPGTGKTTIMRAIERSSSLWGFATVDMSSARPGKGLHELAPGTFGEAFRNIRKQNKEESVLVLVDEALREPTVGFLLNNAPTLLDAAHAEGVRFLFISAGLTPDLERADEWREFFRRSQTHYLPSLKTRPKDIPYIVPARFFEKCGELTSLRIGGRFLLAVADLALVTPGPSLVCDIVDGVLKSATFDPADFAVTYGHLPKERRPTVEIPGSFAEYEFHR